MRCKGRVKGGGEGKGGLPIPDARNVCKPKRG